MQHRCSEFEFEFEFESTVNGHINEFLGNLQMSVKLQHLRLPGHNTSQHKEICIW